MALFYPHKQTLVIALVCAIIVGSAAYLAFKDSSSGQPADSQPIVKADSVESAPIPDNGDWQKQFFANATSTFSAGSASAKASVSGAPLTATDILGEEFFSRYMQVRQAGLTNDPDIMNSVGSQLMSDSLGSIDAPQPFPLSSIRVVTAADDATLQKYASSLGTILAIYIPDQDHNEATLAEQALEQGNIDALATIDPIIANYKAALQALMAMPVPKPLASYHLNLMNGIAVSLFNAESLRHVDKDPVKGMAAIGLEVQGLQFMSDAVAAIQQYLSSYGIALG